MGILSWIIFGLIAGIVAKLIMPGEDPGGSIITISSVSPAQSSGDSSLVRWGSARLPASTLAALSSLS
jgi:hypothetical protein